MFCLNTTKKSETKSILREIHAKKMSLKWSQTIILLCLRNLVGSIQSHSLQLIRIIHQISGCQLATHLLLLRGGRSSHPVVRPSARRSEPHPAALQEGSHGAQVIRCSATADQLPVSTTCCRLAEWREPRARRGWSLGSEAGRSGWDGRDARSWWAEPKAKHLLTCTHMQWSDRIQANDGI